MKRSKNPNLNNIVYGLHTVMATLKFQPERCKKLYIARKTDSKELTNLCHQSGIFYELVEREWLERSFGVSSDAQGVVLQCNPFAYTKLEDLLEHGKRILLLDSWQDAANLGRAARAALCFGADGMVICQDRSAPISPPAEKSAVGALAQVPVARVVNLAAAIKKIKETGFFVYGADEHGDVPLKQCDFADRVALVIGQEGEGLRSLTKKSCDVLVSIPMANTDICLNAADTALVMLYELSSKN